MLIHSHKFGVNMSICANVSTYAMLVEKKKVSRFGRPQTLEILLMCVPRNSGFSATKVDHCGLLLLNGAK